MLYLFEVDVLCK